VATRADAVNPVAAAVLARVNVPAVRALAPGGVSRNRVRRGGPPFIMIGPSQAGPDDAMGAAWGAVVDVPVHVITAGDDIDGESKGQAIAAAVVALVTDPATPLVVAGFAVRSVAWGGTTCAPVAFADDFVGYDTAATLTITVRQT
jgi:hypothetical protein